MVLEIWRQLRDIDRDVAISLLNRQLDVLDKLIHLQSLIRLGFHKGQVNFADHLSQIIELVFDEIVLILGHIESKFKNDYNFRPPPSLK